MGRGAAAVGSAAERGAPNFPGQGYLGVLGAVVDRSTAVVARAGDQVVIYVAIRRVCTELCQLARGHGTFGVDQKQPGRCRHGLLLQRLHLRAFLRRGVPDPSVYQRPICSPV